MVNFHSYFVFETIFHWIITKIVMCFHICSLLPFVHLEKEWATWDFKAATTTYGTPREQKKVEEEGSDMTMPTLGNAHMTFVEKAMAEQTTKLPKPHQYKQKQNEHGK
jgi:hypothetical protein